MPFLFKKNLKHLLLLVILAFVIFSRFTWLSEKPYHHDESQYATFSWYTYNGSAYKYNPILHGPFLTYFNVFLYSILGDSNFSARFGPAFLGVVLVLLLYYFSRFLGKFAAFTLMIMYAISPCFTYFARFLGTDIYIALFSVLFIFFFAEHVRTRKPAFIYLSAGALAFLFLIKVNSYIYAFIFLSFLMILKLAKFPADIETYKRRYIDTLKLQLLHVFLGCILFFVIFAVFYTSFFTYIQGFFDGLFLKSLGYWAGQHTSQRIKGDFHYYLPIMLIYELPVIIVAAGGLLKKILENRKAVLITAGVLTFSITLTIIPSIFWDKSFFGGSKTTKDAFDYIFHIQSPWHILMIIMLIHSGVYCIHSYIEEGRIFLSFVTYWLIFSVLVYSYAGEKVPWLTLNILMPTIFYAAIIFSDFYRKIRPRMILRISTFAVLAIFCAFTVFIQLRVCLDNPADPKERLVYVQTSDEMLLLVDKINAIAQKTGKGKSLKIAVHSEAGWPLNWYLRNYETIYPPPDINNQDNDIIIIDFMDTPKYSRLEKNYDFKRVKLRVWWVPGKIKNGIKDIFNYYIFRKVWSRLGSLDIAVYINKGIE